MARERRITVRAPEKLHKAVRVKAAELGRPVSEIVRELLELWTAGEIELPAPTGEDQPETE
ncbi:MAG: ribbon-helix-helix domain-containing protein [Promethearchaeota archaeon]